MLNPFSAQQRKKHVMGHTFEYKPSDHLSCAQAFFISSFRLLYSKNIRDIFLKVFNLLTKINAIEIIPGCCFAMNGTEIDHFQTHVHILAAAVADVTLSLD